MLGRLLLRSILWLRPGSARARALAVEVRSAHRDLAHAVVVVVRMVVWHLQMW